MKPTIEPMTSGRIPAILLPRVLKPISTPLVTDLRPLVNAFIITPIVVATANTTAVKPYFLSTTDCETIFLECISHSLS